MKISPVLPALCLFVLASTGFSTETKFWRQGDVTDFQKGSLTHLSLRSDGRLLLAPQFPEIFDSSTPYLWTVASDSKGNVYTAGGGTGSGAAKIFMIDPSGKSSTLAELDGLEIHALAVDSRDQIYAATDPDGKVYRIQGGKPQLFFDPHQKYIWTMAFNSKGDLFVATGQQGEIYRVTRDGTGSVFFKTEETHARSMAIDAHDNLIVGTEPSGLILRVTPAGQGFVLYQASKREITAIGIAKDGSIWAAGVGSKSAVPAAPAALEPPSAHVVAPSLPNAPPALRATPPPSFSFSAPTITGGSELYRIDPDGSPHKEWSDNRDIVYAIGFNQDGRPLLGTGNRGRIYRLDSEILYTLLLDASPTQVTGFGSGPHGEVYAVTGNIGKLFRVGPGLEKSGSFESEVLDAESFSYWGRLSYRGSGGVVVSTRSGNLNHPENNWSPWAPLQPDGNAVTCSSCGGGRVPSPPARFVQYKLELSASASHPLPQVSYVDLAYLSKNVAPTVDEIDPTPPNYKINPPVLSITTTTITLPPVGHAPSTTTPSSESSQTLNYAKGFTGVRWAASDDNGDTLVYKVEIRGVQETAWRVLRDNLKEKYLTWDSTPYADGEYVVRITASDSPSNPHGQALDGSLVSEPFLIDNTPPRILNLAATVSGNKVDVRWKARDERSNIDHADYNDGGLDWMLAQPVSRLTDSPEEEYHVVLDRKAGEQVIAVRVTDEFDNQTVEKVVVK